MQIVQALVRIRGHL